MERCPRVNETDSSLSITRSIAEEIRAKAEGDLEAFIKLVHPHRALAKVHKDFIKWLTRKNAKSHQMGLLPRDHMKSAIAAYWVAWHITKNPAVRVLYISSTANLAEKQLGFIKQILTCDQYRRYWPEMVNLDEGKREKWTNTEISVDHPIRKKESVRDPTVFTGGLTTGLTGLHCDIAVLDDTVVQENAYTEEGRSRVRSQYSLLSSIEGAEALELVVGTRYHPKDLYAELLVKQVELFSDDGDLESSETLYEVFERVVEDSVNRDGSGNYLWPRADRGDGKKFGFDAKILAKKRAQYLDKTQFYAQYYNDPNDVSTSAISREYFQYFDRSKIKRDNGYWYINGNRVNIFAAIDFAYTKRQTSDYTAIVVVAIDANGNHYVLEIDRFKTGLISEYFKHILDLHVKWDFRKIRCEVTAAQEVIVKDLKESYIRPYGLSLSVEEHRPTRQEGRKEERIEATLQPKYANLQMWHYQGGNCEILEEELTLQNPAHDDVKDALASVVPICVPPTSERMRRTSTLNSGMFNSRFGGVQY